MNRTARHGLVTMLLVIPIALHAQGWTRLHTTGDPPARRNASAIYDARSHRIVVFGGSGTSGNVNDLWALDLNTLQWHRIVPISGTEPAARFSHNAVLDSARQRMIIWSGQGSSFFNDVWAFDFVTSSWQELWANGNVAGAPLVRYGTAAAFDPVNRRLINFAGFTSSGRFKDTWDFHVDQRTWTDRSDNNNPLERCLHTGAFVPDRRTMAIYGGQRSGTLDDIWMLNVDSFVWTNVTPASRPPGRWFSSLVYDGHGGLIMFGGQTMTGVANDLWRFSIAGNTWESMISPGQQPDARFGHTAVYVPSRHSLIIFGGEGSALFNDTWAFSVDPTTHVGTPDIPRTFALDQNYPNPFNSMTTIGFQLLDAHRQTSVTLRVVNLLGQTIVTLVDEPLPAGAYRVVWNAASAPSGTYVYQLKADNVFHTKSMILLR